jgi:DNA polymerase III subunit delta
LPLKPLTKDLKQQLLPVYLFLGEADFLVEGAGRLVIEAVLPSCGLAAFNFATFRGTETGTIPAISNARTLPMMSERRLVVLKSVHEANSADLEALVDYVAAPSITTTLVITGAKFPRPQKGQPNWATRLQNAVKKVGWFDKPDEKNVNRASLAMQRARDHGKRLSKAAADLLVETLGEGLASIRNEVDKLCLYVGDAEEITTDHVSETVALLADAAVWDLTLGIAARDVDLALSSMHRLLEDGKASRQLLSLIQWRLRQLLVMKELHDAGASEDRIKQAGKAWRDWRRIKPTLKTLAPAHVVLRRVAQTNLLMNSHRAGDRRQLEQLVLTLMG